MSTNKKFGLGRGLESLLGEDDVVLNLDQGKDIETFVNNTVFKNEDPYEVSVADIHPCSFQPRTEFKAESLQALCDSIKDKGILQPLLLRRNKGQYEIIAGERRWRAAKMAGLKTVPAIVKNLNDQQTLEIALIENLQRENLSAIEEAEGLNRLQEEYGYKQEVLGKIIGKSRSYVANTLRLLLLPQEVKQMVRTNKLSAGHARALIGYPQALSLAKQIIEKGLSVRQTEMLVGATKEKKTIKKNKEVDFDLKQIIENLQEKLKLKVKINAGQNGKGSITLHYANPAELSSILDLLEQR